MDGGAPTVELTRREREILGLITQGLTDRQIAAALGVRPRTIEWHVGNILKKLAVTGRAAAAVYAVRRGLA